MRKYLLFLVFIFFFINAHAFVFLENQENTLLMSTGNSSIFTIRFFTNELINKTDRGVFWIASDNTMLINAKQGYYHDAIGIINSTWIQKKYNLTVYEPGNRLLYWGFTLSNGTNYTYNMSLEVTGELMIIPNASKYEERMMHYGFDSTKNIVKERLLNKTISNGNLTNNKLGYQEKVIMKEYNLSFSTINSTINNTNTTNLIIIPEERFLLVKNPSIQQDTTSGKIVLITGILLIIIILIAGVIRYLRKTTHELPL